MKNLIQAQSQFRRVLMLLAVFSLVVNLLLLVMPLYMLQIYDRILPTRSMDTLVFLSVIAAGALMVLGLLEAVRAMLAARAAAKLEATIGSDALKVSMDNSRVGEVSIEPMRHLATIRQFVSSRSVFALLDFPFAPIFIGILYILHPVLFWLTLAGAVLLLIIAIINQKVTQAATARAAAQQGSAMVMAQSLARNAQTLHAMGMTRSGVALWGQFNAQSMTQQGSVDTKNAILSGLSRALRMGLQIAILGVGAWLVLNNEMTAGMIFAASIISGRALQPIDQVIGGWKHFTTTWRAWQSLKSVLATERADGSKTLLEAPSGRLSVEGAVVLGTDGLSKAPILNRISFDIEPGTVLGIVGPSGSGKSTLARLLVGAQVPQGGTIRIDGTEVQNWDVEQLGQHIGYLGQDVELLPGTVKENIARLSEKPDDLAVLDAARMAQVHSLIQNLPQGYDTRIGPGGLGLSGGQRQRIGLARAFYGNPQIMVLDEPNANLDDDGEFALQRAMTATRARGVTVILITQRKQILNVVDKILRLHTGKVDFHGSRDEFVALLQKHRKQAEAAKKATQPPAKANPKAKAFLAVPDNGGGGDGDGGSGSGSNNSNPHSQSDAEKV